MPSLKCVLSPSSYNSRFIMSSPSLNVLYHHTDWQHLRKLRSQTQSKDCYGVTEYVRLSDIINQLHTLSNHCYSYNEKFWTVFLAVSWWMASNHNDACLRYASIYLQLKYIIQSRVPFQFHPSIRAYWCKMSSLCLICSYISPAFQQRRMM